ncbi:MAG: pyridoxal-phosphate dependent enzyme [Owenweeksia sp.]|nr:pyridoxal-phosphate dependent enzyme [Owenweeksia sp.]
MVGLTPLFALPGLSEHFGHNIYIKSEGHNPSGCFKDRETALCMLNARRLGYKRAVIFSSGNAAASAAIAIQHTDFHLITLVSGDTYEDKIDYIRDHGSDVIVIGDDRINFETGYRLFAKLNAAGEFEQEQYDNWSVINPYRVQGDKTTAIEIHRQLLELAQSPVPDYVIVPTANGSCLAGVWEGFKEMCRLGVIERLPRMVSAGYPQCQPGVPGGTKWPI